MSPRSRPLRERRSATRIERGLQDRIGWWERLLDLPLLWATLAVIGCTWLLIPRLGSSLPRWGPGEVATFDVVVPRDVTVRDEVATEAVREEARSSVLPVYDLEPRLRLELVDRIEGLFRSCRTVRDGEETVADGLAASTDLRIDEAMLRILEGSECDPGLEQALIVVASSLYDSRVVDDLAALERRGERGLVLRDLATGREREVGLGEVAGVIDHRAGLEPVLRALLLEHDVVARRWIRPVIDFLEANIGPNLIFSRAETSARVRAAAEQVQPRSQVLQRGQVLVRRGDTVTIGTARTLTVLNEERGEIADYSKVAGIGLLMALTVLGWWRVLIRFSDRAELRGRLSMVFLLLLLFSALDRFGVFTASALAFNSQGGVMSTVDAYLWAVPYAAGPATVCLLIGIQPAVLFALCGSLVAGLMLGGDFTTVVYSLASGVVGALAAQQFKQRTALSRAGAVVGVTNLVVMLILELYQGLPELPETMALAAVAAFVGGPLSVAVASFLLPLLEVAFGITTDVRLLELSNQNLPLLKRLSLEAPGTYQHSLAVGNLAEAGADAVGANSLLLRVCAYYHDVGKLVKPEYFVENQRGSNPHDGLSPSMSALVIQSHVKEGLEMARRAKLPLPIRQGIATHHGTKLIRYFYSKAKDQTAPEHGEVRESNYRYPGPKPHTKELGILLLADAVEAAARTLDSPAPGRIQSMIGKIFANSLEDGQLDDCDLTFSELDKIATAFLWVLTNMYHHRIEYPGFDFNRRQEKRDSGSIHLGTKTVATSGS